MAGPGPKNDRQAGTSPPAPLPEVYVWDPLVRIFHWALVAAFTIAFATGDELPRLHEMTGYTIFGLVALRVLWGFIGTRHARFSDFVVGPRAVIGYLRDVAGFRAKRHVGHNPAGGAMILLLLVTLMMTAATGLLTDSLPKGGLRHAIEEVHEFFANGMLALVVVHVAGVIASSLVHGENLVRAMFTGRKRA